MSAKYLFFVVISFLVTTYVFGRKEYAVFYEGSNFQGETMIFSFSRCSNLPKNFNNKVSSLDNRNNCLRLWDMECCQGKSMEIKRDSLRKYSDLSLMDFDKIATSVSPCGDYPTGETPLFLEESWHNITEIVDKVYEDEDATFYYDITVNRRVAWPQEFIGNTWRYVKKIYGDFGPEGGRLFPILHSESERVSSVKSYFEPSGHCRNIMDLNSPLKNGWNEQKEENMDAILREMSKFVLTASNGVDGSAVQSFWDKGNLTDKWTEIFVYDVYKGVGLNEEAERWFNQTVNSTENFPRQEIATNWFRDWFFPIYKKYGKTEALKKYFSSLDQHFPRNSDANYKYEHQEEMNMEEYVHLWSTAVGTNLRPLAEKAFGWDVTSEYKLIQAQLKFPMRYEGL